MKKKLLGGSSLLLVVVTLLIASPAQDTQRFEAFGGYSFTYKSPISDGDHINFNGWNTSSTVFVNRWLGLTADFSGSYASSKIPIFCYPGGCFYEHGSFSSYSYLFGPHVVYRRSRYAPFVETLFGIHNPHTTISPLNSQQCPPITDCSQLGSNTTSYHRFAMAIGGGLDIALSHDISIRPVQVDYLFQRDPYWNFDNNGNLVDVGASNNTFRYSGGITFRFGSHLGPTQ
jgi:opacity protein-like surface antigen